MKLFALLFFLIGVKSFAAEHFSNELLEAISQNPTWLKLLHYQKKTLGRGYASTVRTSTFFLNKKGKHDPFLELKSTLRAFQLPIKKDANSHAICLYPARYFFLSQKIKKLKGLSQKVTCSKYNKWVEEDQIESVSLIFATGYLSNPASYYGHVLFRFHSKIGNNPLLDLSVNYGARVPPKENPVLYILKGLFGGYSASYTSSHAYTHNHNYAEDDLRDMWIYRLDLDKRKRLLLLKHLWELLENKFIYYFTKQNCAYKMLEFLEIGIDDRIFNRFVPWTLPVDVFHAVHKLQNENKLTVKGITMIPSLASRVKEKYDSLPFEDQNLIKTVLKAKSLEPLKEKGVRTRKRLLPLLNTYYKYLYKKDKNSYYTESRNEVLVELAKLKTQFPEEPLEKKVQTEPLHESQKPSLFESKFITNSLNSSFLALRVRPAYYDLMSPQTGHAPYSALSMFDLTFRINKDSVFISQLDLIHIDNLNLKKEALPGDSLWGWSLRIGLDQDQVCCLNCPQYYASGGIGRSLFLSDWAFYLFLQGRPQVDNKAKFRLLGGARIGVLSPISYKFRLHMNYRYSEPLLDSGVEKLIFSLEARYLLSQNIEFSLEYIANIYEEYRAGLQFYW